MTDDTQATIAAMRAGAAALRREASTWGSLAATPELDKATILTALAAAFPAMAEDIEALRAEVVRLRKCLMPVWMGMAESEMMLGEPLPDKARVLSFMGSGASDFVTAGEIRAALKGPSDDQ